MKSIHLYGPSRRNGGDYVDAGETVDVGDGADAIDTDRAKALAEQGVAVTITEARADERAAKAASDA